MMTLTLLLIFAVSLVAFAYKGAPVRLAAYTLAGLTAVSMMTSASGLLTLFFTLTTLLALLFSVPALRQKLLSRPALGLVRKVLPPISETEQEAIDAGSVWWDGEIFSGKPDWPLLMDAPKPSLSKEEQAFLDGPVNELCRLSDAWKINHDWNLIPEPIIRYVCEKGFLGMIIPKEYGGLGFSAFAQSQILLRLTNTGGGVSYLVGVPNSLGPGELLIKYGTKEQKNHYLPRLANGSEIPCFALTGPTAGSDATSIPDTGVVCKGNWQGEAVLGMRINFSKRYITLAPVATLIGLAFRLLDPDGLLADEQSEAKTDYGITCALIPRDTRGLEIGRRHMPIGDVFLNGPINGKDIFVPLDFIIGGPKMAGKGWRMLVNCLSVGRAVTLPTTAVAVGKRTVMGTSAYAALRKQFGVSLNKFEGIQKPLARLAGYAYIIDAARSQTIQSIADGHKPSVPSAILKYHCTEMARQCLLDAMDIHGGKAVMKGPKNYVAPLYESIPVAITVEGANILTRNLMIFGQGAIRSHPFVLREMELARALDENSALPDFDQTLTAHIGYTLQNAARSLVLGLTPDALSKLGSPTRDPDINRYFRHIERLSNVFALTADASLLSLGAGLKFREMLSARLGDLLSTLYLASMVLKQHKDNDYAPDEWPIVQWALDQLLYQFQVAFDELLVNYPNRILARLLSFSAFPVGKRFKRPLDKLEKEVVEKISQDSGARQRLTSGCFMEPLAHNPLAEVNQVFLESLVIAPLQEKLRQAIKSGRLPKLGNAELIDEAKSESIISAEEADRLHEFDKKLMNIIHVDDFDEAELIRTPFAGPSEPADPDSWLKAS